MLHAVLLERVVQSLCWYVSLVLNYACMTGLNVSIVTTHDSFLWFVLLTFLILCLCIYYVELVCSFLLFSLSCVLSNLRCLRTGMLCSLLVLACRFLCSSVMLPCDGRDCEMYLPLGSDQAWNNGWSWSPWHKIRGRLNEVRWPSCFSQWEICRFLQAGSV